MNWPLLYKQVLIVNNPHSHIGVATMWTERQVVAKLLDGLDYSVIGNLYSSAGISALIRNIYANPHITKLILWGADLSRSGQALVEFVKNGTDAQNFIIGNSKRGQIEPEITREALNLFRQSVEVVNLRGKSPSDLISAVKDLHRKKSSAFSRPQTFPQTKPQNQTLPSEQIGFRIHGQTVAQTWLKILNNIKRYGRTKETRYARENNLRELLNVMAVIYAENISDPYLPHYLPFTKKDLDVYYPQVISAKIIPGISYTYGQRLRNNHGIDQIQKIIDLVKTRPFSKKMVAFTADIAHDWSNVHNGDTPCLTQVLCSVQDDKLYLTAHFRSQDMVHGWPRNAFSLLKLQDLIAGETGYKKGALTTISHSAHIYADDYLLIDSILKGSYETELGYSSRTMFEIDPRGNIVISVEPMAITEVSDGIGIDSPSYEIVVKLYAPEGGLVLQEWRGQSAMEVYISMVNIGDYLVLPSHLVYIGTELQRAEYAIKIGQPFAYNQDPAAHKKIL